MARDAGTKTDQPSDGEGQGPDPKVAQDAADGAAAVNTEQSQLVEQSAPPEAVEAAEPTEPQADGTAAATTGVDKAGAEAGATGAAAPAKRGRKADGGGRASEKERTRKPKAETAAAEAPPAEAPAKRTRASKQAETPAPRRQRRRTNDPTGRVTVRAQAKFVRSSARKARLVADHVRGKDVDQARAILAFSPRSVAEDWRKLLESAIANAEHNHDLVGDDLRVLNATADEGPTLKRFRPRAMGRATRIRKRTAHLTITLTPKD
jgi:ribosomal protein L22